MVTPDETREGETRDVALGTALASLEVPDHRPGFLAELARALHADDGAPAAHGARGRAPSGAGAPPAATAPPPHDVPRRPPSRHRTRARWTGLAAAVAVVAATIVVATSSLPPSHAPVATAAEVRAAVAQAWTGARTIAGELVTEDAGGQARHWSFLLTASGDARVDDRTLGGTHVYDATANVERALLPSESLGSDTDGDVVLFASEHRGLAPGRPDRAPAASELLRLRLGSVVRALVAGGASGNGATVGETVHEGRPAWLLDTDVPVNLIVPDHSPDHLLVTVDQETGFPVRVVASNAGRRLYETRVDELRVDPPVAPGAFTLELPDNDDTYRVDHGFRDVALGEVAGLTGREAPAPAWVPDGYTLAEVRVSHEGSPTGTEGMNPPTAPVVSLSYRRGLEQLIVTSRPVGDDPGAWGDPLAAGEGYPQEPEVVRLDTGVLAGRRAELIVDLLTIPHLWGVSDDLVLTVAGDVTRDELVAIAASID